SRDWSSDVCSSDLLLRLYAPFFYLFLYRLSSRAYFNVLTNFAIFHRSSGLICEPCAHISPLPCVITWKMWPSEIPISAALVRFATPAYFSATGPSPLPWGPWQCVQYTA